MIEALTGIIHVVTVSTSRSPYSLLLVEPVGEPIAGGVSLGRVAVAVLVGLVHVGGDDDGVSGRGVDEVGAGAGH